MSPYARPIIDRLPDGTPIPYALDGLDEAAGVLTWTAAGRVVRVELLDAPAGYLDALDDGPGVWREPMLDEVDVRVYRTTQSGWSMLLDAVRALAGADGVVEAVVSSGPLTSWQAIALVVGVSDDTLKRRRKDKGDTSPPWFADADAARRWYARLVGVVEVEAEPRVRRPKTTSTHTEGPTLDDRRRRPRP